MKRYLTPAGAFWISYFGLCLMVAVVMIMVLYRYGGLCPIFCRVEGDSGQHAVSAGKRGNR
jgi:hypothetical protein